MQIYIGQTRSRKLISRFNEFGWGECTVRGEYPPRRNPWFFDNGAFRDWKAGKLFDEDRFRADIERIRTSDSCPDFIVAPDIVTCGVGSLAFSRTWLPLLRGVAPVYLAVQDGMETHNIDMDEWDGLFVGGTLEWKIATGEKWVKLAHQHDKKCHIGRVGTRKRVQWALRIRADSVDSCLPLWSEGNLQTFQRGLNDPQTGWNF